jgi:hypothetical protein
MTFMIVGDDAATQAIVDAYDIAQDWLDHDDGDHNPESEIMRAMAQALALIVVATDEAGVH